MFAFHAGVILLAAAKNLVEARHGGPIIGVVSHAVFAVPDQRVGGADLFRADVALVVVVFAAQMVQNLFFVRNCDADAANAELAHPECGPGRRR